MREDEEVLIGLPDTVWFPLDGYRTLGCSELAFLLFRSIARSSLTRW